MKYPLKEYEVWSEGYSATGDYSPAFLIGKVMARSFKQACHILACRQYLEFTERINNTNDYTDADRWDYNPLSVSYWGCKWYDNEVDARKSFG